MAPAQRISVLIHGQHMGALAANSYNGPLSFQRREVAIKRNPKQHLLGVSGVVASSA